MKTLQSLIEDNLGVHEIIEKVFSLSSRSVDEDVDLSDDTLRERIEQELAHASRKVYGLNNDPHKWMQYWLVQQTLLWILSPQDTASPSDVIERDAPRTHARVKQRDQTRTQEDL